MSPSYPNLGAASTPAAMDPVVDLLGGGMRKIIRDSPSEKKQRASRVRIATRMAHDDTGRLLDWPYQPKPAIFFRKWGANQ